MAFSPDGQFLACRLASSIGLWTYQPRNAIPYRTLGGRAEGWFTLSPFPLMEIGYRWNPFSKQVRNTSQIRDVESPTFSVSRS